MSMFLPLVSWAALAFALVVLVIVWIYATPFVAWSAWLYRLLLAAYPAAFRAEYGSEMLQVFRDTARAEYRRRGLWGLLVVWLRTLADFSVSVVRQHREQAATAVASSESVLLRDLLRQWHQFAIATLSATSFSIWYIFHLFSLFFQRHLLVWTTLTVFAVGAWVGSFVHGIPVMSHGSPKIGIVRGLIVIYYAAADGPPVPDEQWQQETRAWREANPATCALLQSRLGSIPKPWEFRLLRDIPGAVVVQWKADRKTPAFVRPYKEWQLYFPLFPVPLVLLLGTVRAYRRRRAVPNPSMQSA